MVTLNQCMVSSNGIMEPKPPGWDAAYNGACFQGMKLAGILVGGNGDVFSSICTYLVQRGNVQQFTRFVIWPPGDLLWLPARSHPLKLGGATKEIGQVYEHGTWPSQNIKHHALFPTLWWKSWSERCKERQGLKVDGMTSMGETVAV